MACSDLDSDDLIDIALALTVKKRKKRSKWCKNWLLKRSGLSHTGLLNEIRLEPDDWFNYLRMDETTYLELLSMVAPLIERRETMMRKPISSHERLTATLRYLATGRSYQDLKFSTIISPQALGRIIPETCDAIYRVLKKDYLKFPRDERGWKNVAQEFEDKWQFPNCLGAIDGKHITIMAPPNSGSYYLNYKGCNSIVLLGIANANYEFLMCDVGTNGRISDGGVLGNTKFGEYLVQEKLNLPGPTKPVNSSRLLPYVFIGDEAFALRKDFLTPFPSKESTQELRIFNYRLSRARRIIDDVFGIMTSRFRIFCAPITIQVASVEKVVLACCLLHNFLRKKCSASYAPPENMYPENGDGSEMVSGAVPAANAMFELQRTRTRSPSQMATEVRDNYKSYFAEEGAVPWQVNMIGYQQI